MGNRIESAMLKANVNQTELAKVLGVTPQAVQQWVKGGTAPKGKRLMAIASALNTDVNWLVTGKPDGYITPRIPDGTARALPVFDAPIEPGDEYLPVKVVSFKLQAGIVGYAVEYLDEDDNDPIYFRADWFIKHGYKHERLLAFKVKGESMTPKLYSGDLVVINTDDSQAKDGKVFAVNYEGEMVIKRMVRDGGQWWLASDNPDKTSYPNKLCAGDYCIVIGRVVYRQTQEI